ncbi:MAG: response regulator [Syntrophorhabdales bacterium]|jgi:PAS domain S-box-containing protein
MAEKRTTEEALGQAEERYRNLYENAREGIFRISLDGRFISANPAMARILGYGSPEELIDSVDTIGKQVCVSEGRWQDCVHVMEAEGLVRDFEIQVRCKDGGMGFVSINAGAVLDERGNMLYHEGMVENITERKTLEAQLLEAQRIEGMGALVGGIAHDFNNILTTIMGYCSLILMKAGSGTEFTGYANHIMQAADRASSLTHSLLAFSRRQAVEARTVDVNEAIKVVEKLLRRVIGDDIELRTSFSSERLAVLIGDGRIGQLVMNLATNARDAMPDGGVLGIRTEQVHLGEDFMKARDGKEGAYASIEVSHTGGGTHGHARDAGFDPLSPAQGAGTETPGLSIVYEIVRENEGYMHVAGLPDGGTAFTIYLPLAGPASGEAALRETEELRGGSEVILVAEDNEDVRQIIATILRDFGYVVVEAVDGVDAVEKFNENREAVDLLLLDVIMPRRNGKEAYGELKKVRPDIRVIFMSGYTGEILSRKEIGGEGIPIISKPIVIEKLLRQVREILDAKPSQLSLFP